MKSKFHSIWLQYPVTIVKEVCFYGAFNADAMMHLVVLIRQREEKNKQTDRNKFLLKPGLILCQSQTHHHEQDDIELVQFPY